ncbi:unnamed protein product [Commensalibacter communis]|nr:unnamed protein product [Commensalibacter communis]
MNKNVKKIYFILNINKNIDFINNILIFINNNTRSLFQ